MHLGNEYSFLISLPCLNPSTEPVPVSPERPTPSRRVPAAAHLPIYPPVVTVPGV